MTPEKAVAEGWDRHRALQKALSATGLCDHDVTHVLAALRDSGWSLVHGDGPAEEPVTAEPVTMRDVWFYQAGRAVGASRAHGGGLDAAVRAVLDHAEVDDNFDGEYLDFLVPAEYIEALRAALRGDNP